tara:strand:+ start:441 stop:623 length:183 start_codon:yes stop_codon:yes gene_type:complete
MEMPSVYIVIAAVIVILFFNILGLALCRSSARADRQAAEHFALLENKYRKQVRDDLKKKG